MTFTTRLTTSQLEARDTTISPLVFRVAVSDLDDRYLVGDNLVINSKDGDIFIGHIEDTDDDAGFIYVELD